jgi:hypothetical protein
MPLSPELQTAAQSLGQALRATPQVQAYQAACQAAQNDPETAELENQLSRLEQAVQNDPAVRQEFYELRSKARFMALIAEREARLDVLKANFSGACHMLSEAIGLDYPDFARRKPA